MLSFSTVFFSKFVPLVNFSAHFSYFLTSLSNYCTFQSSAVREMERKCCLLAQYLSINFFDLLTFFNIAAISWQAYETLCFPIDSCQCERKEVLSFSAVFFHKFVRLVNLRAYCCYCLASL